MKKHIKYLAVLAVMFLIIVGVFIGTTVHSNRVSSDVKNLPVFVSREASVRESSSEEETEALVTETFEEETEESSLDEETETEAEKEKFDASKLDPDAFGTTAYKYLRIINDNYPYRLVGNGETRDNKYYLADFIVSEMSSFGYTPKKYSYSHSNADGNTYDLNSYSFVKPGDSPKKIVVGAHYDSRESNGCEDNGSGVSVILELAKRLVNVETPLTIEFCFFDGEELQDYAGSYSYLNQTDQENIFLYMNIDCVGFGDNMYVYGGHYNEDGSLVRLWGFNEAITVAKELGYSLNSIPKVIGEEYEDMIAPIRTAGSDQIYFDKYNIPYVYFEANAWVDDEGNPVYPSGLKPFQHNSNNPYFADTEGQINHTKYDDLDVLEEVLGDIGYQHISIFTEIAYTMLTQTTLECPELFK